MQKWSHSYERNDGRTKEFLKILTNSRKHFERKKKDIRIVEKERQINSNDYFGNESTMWR